MSAVTLPEVWLRGPIEGIPPLLQPVAHALLQAREEVSRMVVGFPEELLWVKPNGLASAGFHLQHLSGVIDRLFTYAEGKSLSDAQFERLQIEGSEPPGGASVKQLVEEFSITVDRAMVRLKSTDEGTLTEIRTVGRSRVPSTQIGLLVHAAEHSMRHVGQLLVTIRMLKS